MLAIGSKDEQLKHYQAVKQRIAANAKPEPARLPAIETPKPVARMVVPTIAQLDAMTAAEKLRMRAEIIVQECAHKYAVSVADIRSARRFPSTMRARREAMYRLCTELGWTQARTGDFLNKDHSSVHHAMMMHRKEHGL